MSGNCGKEFMKEEKLRQKEILVFIYGFDNKIFTDLPALKIEIFKDFYK